MRGTRIRKSRGERAIRLSWVKFSLVVLSLQFLVSENIKKPFNTCVSSESFSRYNLRSFPFLSVQNIFLVQRHRQLKFSSQIKHYNRPITIPSSIRTLDNKTQSEDRKIFSVLNRTKSNSYTIVSKSRPGSKSGSMKYWYSEKSLSSRNGS